MGMMILTLRSCPEAERQSMKNAAQCPTQHGCKRCGGCSDDDDDDDDSDVAPQFDCFAAMTASIGSITTSPSYVVTARAPHQPCRSQEIKTETKLVASGPEQSVVPGQVEAQGQISSPQKPYLTSQGKEGELGSARPHGGRHREECQSPES